MNFDLRLPIGIMFSLFGAMLAIFGLASSRNSTVLDININLWWGLVLLAFGVLMLVFAWRRRQMPPEQK
ncbi:MAG: hypothetical protein ABSD57_07565 [Verrucomicrobiota bacterium]|jgi:membrane protein implicated in regulation of membrane protease activity